MVVGDATRPGGYAIYKFFCYNHSVKLYYWGNFLLQYLFGLCIIASNFPLHAILWINIIGFFLLYTCGFASLEVLLRYNRTEALLQ
jgi:hypothetical protein